MDETLHQLEQQLQVDPNPETAYRILAQYFRLGKINREALEDAAALGYSPAALVLNQKPKPFNYKGLAQTALLAQKFALTLIYLCVEEWGGTPLLEAKIIYPQHSSGNEWQYHWERLEEHHVVWNREASFGELILVSILKNIKDVIDAYEIPDFDINQTEAIEKYGWNARIIDVSSWVNNVFNLYAWTSAAQRLLKATEALIWIVEWPSTKRKSRFKRLSAELKKMEEDPFIDDVLAEILREEVYNDWGFTPEQLKNYHNSVRYALKAYTEVHSEISKPEAQRQLLERARIRLIKNLLGEIFA
jgi:hypothetical protein